MRCAPNIAALMRRLAMILMVALVTSAAAAREDTDPANVYVAGAEVRIDSPVDGDLFAAAGRVRVDQPVSGDAILAAGSLEVRSRIGDDLRAAGGIVSFTGRVAGEALIAGGSIAFGPETEILGRAWLAGGNVVVAGHLADGLQVYGKNILLLGDIDGAVRLTGEHIEILPSARINGDITYSSNNQIKIAPGAQIHGSVTHMPGSFELPFPGFEIPGLQALRPLLLLGLLAAGVLLLVLFPRFTSNSQQAIDTLPLKSLGLGTAIFFSLPPVIVLLIITIIGIPIALALAALYAVALLVSYLITALYVGDKLMRAALGKHQAEFGWRIGALLAALVLLELARSIPYAGGFVLLLAPIAGLGAMVLQAFSHYSNRA